MNAREAHFIKETAKATVKELLNQRLIKNNDMTPHKKIEQLLYHYPSFKAGLKIKEETILTVQIEGVPGHSSSITTFSGIMGGEFETELEKKETKLEELIRSVNLTKKAIGMIEGALKIIENDPYYDIIPLKYWEMKTHEDIAEIFQKEVSTITKNKIRLISELKVALFSDDVIKEIFG